MTGFVYFLRSGAFVKIGFSSKPRMRLAALQTATPHEVEVLGMLPGTRDQEQALHRILAHLHHRREWFRWDPEIADVLKYGLPHVDTSPVRPRVHRAFADFIQASGLPDQHFADALGVSLSGLRKWKARDREPDAATIARIEKLTGGEVSLVDWATPRSVAGEQRSASAA